MAYPNMLTHTDTWVTNCTGDEVFEYVVMYQNRYPDHEIHADKPQDMRLLVSKGACQDELMAMNYWGIYRRGGVPNVLSNVLGRYKRSSVGLPQPGCE